MSRREEKIHAHAQSPTGSGGPDRVDGLLGHDHHHRVAAGHDGDPNSSKSGSATPRTESFSTTSFGNYEFRAEAPGFDTFYGILPLKFNGGYLAADILLFAPAMFFNLREVYAFYEFDLTKKQVLYKQKPTEEWSIFVPLEADAAQGREAFAPKK